MTTILITGGTGTFGNAATDALLKDSSVTRIAILSRDEQKQEQMARLFPDERMRFFVGDVRDKSRLEMAFRGFDVVIHAAAMKIVPKCEYDPIEAVATNVRGSHNVIEAAILSGVKKVIAISSDKAVSPTNLYGATKLASERLFIAGNALSGAGGPVFSVVRYGNVSGSRGSVIPLWRRKAAAGERLPITDPAMTRFWISVEDAVAFVLGAISVQRGGEVFIPKMPSFRIIDLGSAIYGQDVFPMEIVGIRPGEKIHEDLITEHEARNTSENPYAYVICPPWAPPAEPVAAGFKLTSATNDRWLTAAEMREIIEGVGA